MMTSPRHPPPPPPPSRPSPSFLASTLFAIALLGPPAVKAQVTTEQTAIDVCFGDNGICALILNYFCDTDPDDPDVYWSCYCETIAPYRIACETCKYEYDFKDSLDPDYYPSLCSSAGFTIGTISSSDLSLLSEHLDTITAERSRTFDPATVVTRSMETEGVLGYDVWTNTWGGEEGYGDDGVRETGEAGVEDLGIGPEGEGGARGRNMGVVMGIVVGAAVGVLMVVL